MTQKERIMRHLRVYGSITPMEAMAEYGCYRLGARIWDLRHKDGCDIRTETVTGKNRFGEHTAYARYLLGQDAEQAAQ